MKVAHSVFMKIGPYPEDIDPDEIDFFRRDEEGNIVALTLQIEGEGRFLIPVVPDV